MADIPPVTNPSPEAVLATFNALGAEPIPLDRINHTHLRVVVSRGLWLALNMSTLGEQDEFDAINQEIANRMMGRDQSFK